jgi:shikimate dehydrogenase
MDISVNTKLITLLGDPLKQTFAPKMFNETFRILGLDYFYFPVETGNDNLETLIKAIRCMNFCGFNVTKPNKVKVIEYLDELDPLAEKIGSVNVVTIRNGKLRGYNTDGIGFLDALLASHPMDLKKATFFVFGAGGASRALCATLAFHGAKKLYITDKFNNVSATLVDDINARIAPCAEYIPDGDTSIPKLINASQILVNATGMGMFPHLEETPVDKKLLNKDLLVYDITYNPPKTQLLKDAESIGCKIINGVGMSIGQGIRGFALMTGLPEPTEVMTKVMLDIMAEREKS